MHDKPRRRFIAGAKCPQCGELDKIAVDLDADQRLCVSCGFVEDRPSGDPSLAPAAEPQTRVRRAAARRVETPAEVVTLVDPGKTEKGR